MSSNHKTIISAILGFVIVIFAIPAMALMPGELTLFGSDTFQQALIGENLYGKAPYWLADAMAGIKVGNVRGKFTQGDFVNIIRMLIPEDWLESQGGQLLGQLWSYLNFETSELTLVLNTKELKAKFINGDNQSVFQEIVSSLPLCNQEQIASFEKNLGSGIPDFLSGLPSCKPPEPYYSAYVQHLAGGFSTIYQALPDQVNLAAVVTPYRKQVTSAVEVYRDIHLAVYLSFFLELGLLLLLALINASSIYLLLKSVGIIQVIAGGLVLLLSVIVGLLIYFGGDAITERFASTSWQTAEWFLVIKNSVVILLSRFLIFYGVGGIIPLIIGGGFLYLRRVVKPQPA